MLTARGFHLAGARNYALARARLAEMSRFALMDIGTTVGGVNLPRLGALQSTRERRSRMSSAASSPSRPTSASARFAPSSAARVRIASNSASGMRTKPSDRGGVIGSSFRRSADLAAPEGRVIGREVAVRDPEVPLQLDGIARGERHHGLQPDRGGERDVGGGDFAEGAADFGRAVQH
ncbi:hypothetical protein CF98_41430 [Halopseudomonas bauzanensis]|nr:hypothetical protein CF98_41430 [Halopseudomonas bauzanensis]